MMRGWFAIVSMPHLMRPKSKSATVGCSSYWRIFVWCSRMTYNELFHRPVVLVPTPGHASLQRPRQFQRSRWGLDHPVRTDRLEELRSKKPLPEWGSIPRSFWPNTYVGSHASNRCRPFVSGQRSKGGHESQHFQTLGYRSGALSRQGDDHQAFDVPKVRTTRSDRNPGSNAQN